MIIDGQEASRIKSFYQEYFRVNDINDPVGLTHFFATSTSYNAFDIQMQCSSPQAAAPDEVTACWLPPAPSYKDEVGEGMMRKHKKLLIYLIVQYYGLMIYPLIAYMI